MYNRDYSFLTVDVLNRATTLFDQTATAVASDDKLAGRVARERFSLDLAWLMLRPIHQWNAEALETEYSGPHDLIAALAQWKTDIVTVQQMAGHTNISTTARYDRRGERAKAADKLHLPYRRKAL